MSHHAILAVVRRRLVILAQVCQHSVVGLLSFFHIVKHLFATIRLLLSSFRALVFTTLFQCW